MIKLDNELMKGLSFPDFEVLKCEYDGKQRFLKIYVEGAILNSTEVRKLGKGIICFNNWLSLKVSRFDPHLDKWMLLENYSLEPLKDICEINFSDSTVFLFGFGRRLGHWIQWEIIEPNMYAEFES